MPPYQFPEPICLSPDATDAQFYALWDVTDFQKFEEANKDTFRDFSTKEE